MNRSGTRATGSFVRFPTALLERLLHTPLNGTQWRVLLWVIRNTYGWHQLTAQFSWYKIAKDLSMDRGGVVRAGTRLLELGILRIENAELPNGDDSPHRHAMTNHISSGDNDHRERCQESALFRRAKDTSKERIKKYIKIALAQGDDLQKRRDTKTHTARPHLADTAQPIPRKYDSLSEN